MNNRTTGFPNRSPIHSAASHNYPELQMHTLTCRYSLTANPFIHAHPPNAVHPHPAKSSPQQRFYPNLPATREHPGTPNLPHPPKPQPLAAFPTDTKSITKAEAVSIRTPLLHVQIKKRNPDSFAETNEKETKTKSKAPPARVFAFCFKNNPQAYSVTAEAVLAERITLKKAAFFGSPSAPVIAVWVSVKLGAARLATLTSPSFVQEASVSAALP